MIPAHAEAVRNIKNAAENENKGKTDLFSFFVMKPHAWGTFNINFCWVWLGNCSRQRV